MVCCASLDGHFEGRASCVERLDLYSKPVREHRRKEPTHPHRKLL
jgi:hypothetical protein